MASCPYSEAVPIGIATQQLAGPVTIYDTRAYAYMLAVYPPTRPVISCPYSEAVPIGIATQQLIPGPMVSAEPLVLRRLRILALYPIGPGISSGCSPHEDGAVNSV